MNYEISGDAFGKRSGANYQPLTPLAFIERSALVYPNQIAMIHGHIRRTWSETFERCLQLASALRNLGIMPGDTVAVMGANTPELYECHFGVPACGAVLNAMNVRLDPKNIAFILEHAEVKVLLTDTEFSSTIKQALAMIKSTPIIVDIIDAVSDVDGIRLGEIDYELLLETGSNNYKLELPTDEWQSISLNYTSGTTGEPKGVVYDHRGAYLNALGNILSWSMPHHPIYLWTLPMFHCNGWCFPWTLAAIAGTSVCLRKVTARNIYQSIKSEAVTHMCGAPIIMNLIRNADESERHKFSHTVKMMTAAAPPPASLLEDIEKRGFEVTHVYGLTETYGPAVVCAWQDHWNPLDLEQKAQKKARQGVPYHVLQGVSVMDPNTMKEVPSDGNTLGEVMFRGNTVMKGYLKSPEATTESLKNGWFHSGDLGVIHPDGYIELKDRAKDIIISGGENISSIEVENIIFRHPAVMDVAVVAKSDSKWGETPCAFIELKSNSELVSGETILQFCRENLANFKCPRYVVFRDLPKTSTGKIHKFILREEAEKLVVPLENT